MIERKIKKETKKKIEEKDTSLPQQQNLQNILDTTFLIRLLFFFFILGWEYVLDGWNFVVCFSFTSYN